MQILKLILAINAMTLVEIVQVKLLMNVKNAILHFI